MSNSNEELYTKEELDQAISNKEWLLKNDYEQIFKHHIEYDFAQEWEDHKDDYDYWQNKLEEKFKRLGIQND